MQSRRIYGCRQLFFAPLGSCRRLGFDQRHKHARAYQIWKREPLSIELFTEKVFLQKLEYLQQNPVTAGLVNLPEEYHYSSAKFYELGIDDFNILSHYTGNY